MSGDSKLKEQLKRLRPKPDNDHGDQTTITIGDVAGRDNKGNHNTSSRTTTITLSIAITLSLSIALTLTLYALRPSVVNPPFEYKGTRNAEGFVVYPSFEPSYCAGETILYRPRIQIAETARQVQVVQTVYSYEQHRTMSSQVTVINTVEQFTVDKPLPFTIPDDLPVGDYALTSTGQTPVSAVDAFLVPFIIRDCEAERAAAQERAATTPTENE